MMGIQDDYKDAVALAKQGKFKQAEQKLAPYKDHPKVQPLYNKVASKLDTGKKRGIKPVILGLIVIILLGLGAIGAYYVMVILPNQNQADAVIENVDTEANNPEPTVLEALEATVTPVATVTPLPTETPAVDTSGMTQNEADIALITDMLTRVSNLEVPGIQIIDGDAVGGERYLGVGIITKDTYHDIYRTVDHVGSFIRDNNLQFDGMVVQTSPDGQVQSVKVGIHWGDIVAYLNGDISQDELKTRMLIE